MFLDLELAAVNLPHGFYLNGLSLYYVSVLGKPYQLRDHRTLLLVPVVRLPATAVLLPEDQEPHELELMLAEAADGLSLAWCVDGLYRYDLDRYFLVYAGAVFSLAPYVRVASLPDLCKRLEGEELATAEARFFGEILESTHDNVRLLQWRHEA